MNFFQSVFSDDPTSPPDSPQSPSEPSPISDQDPTPNPAAWSFGGFVKNIANKSGSVIQNYRKDLKELGSGLRKETAVIREAASRAIHDLPTSLEAGASVAQESLETVGQAIDNIGATVWKSTAKIIAQGRDTIPDHDESNTVNFDNSNSRISDQLSGDVKPYSRFEMQVRAIQCDFDTYCTAPDDEVEYEKWKLDYFKLEELKEEIELIVENNEVVKKIYDEVVPNKVDDEGFWSRYFYKIHKLKLVEEARSLLVKRAIAGEKDEDLSWDFDDEDDDVADTREKRGDESLPKGESSSSGIVEVENKSGDYNASEGSRESADKEEGKGENGGGSCKDSDLSVVASHQSFLPEEEDLGWDEIEDIGSNDESKAHSVGSGTGTSRVDLQKRLSSTDEEEDLSWDIEDDDDSPVTKQCYRDHLCSDTGLYARVRLRLRLRLLKKVQIQ